MKRLSVMVAIALILTGMCAANAQPVSCTGLPVSNYGCEFRAVALPNPLLDHETFEFVVEVFNPQDDPVDLLVSGGALGAPLAATVPAGASLALPLPWVAALSQATGTLNLVGGSYRIEATRPITAMQWNSREPKIGSTSSFSNDGSLLRPVQSAHSVFRALAWPTVNLGGAQYPGQIAIVATQDGTEVTLNAQGGIQAGAGLGANGGTVMMDAGDVLLVSSQLDAPSGGTGSDLSGMLITSNRPLLAFSGHALANVPANAGFADHMEDSLPGVSAFGREHLVAVPLPPAGATARHFVKIVAHEDTTLATDPAVAGVAAELLAGTSNTFEALHDFRLLSSAPVLVASFLEGSTRFGSDSGDPSQSFVIPATQAQARIDFLAPAIQAPSTALIIAPTGISVTIDGVAVGGWSVIGATGYAVARFALSGPGEAHTAIGSQAFTLSVHAYPDDLGTSWWYPGGFAIATGIFTDGFEVP